MMTKLRSPIALFLILALLLGCFPAVSAQETDSGITLGVGNHVRFGSYEGTELQWQVLHTEDDLALLLCYTPFEFGEYDASPHIYTYTGPSYQYNYGSVTWRTSDVRQFLNSSQRRMNYYDEKFDYSGLTCGTGGGYNTDNSDPRYADRTGFLYEENFMQEERALIEAVTHRTLVPHTDPEAQGEGTLASQDIYNDALYNDTASDLYNGDYLYSDLNDEIFLLSVEEYSKYYYNNDALRQAGFASFPDYRWWLRDTFNSTWEEWWRYYYYGYMVSTPWSTVEGLEAHVDNKAYIRPACWINMSYIEALSGLGTEDDPYRFLIDPEVVNRENYVTRDIYDEHPEHLTLTVYRNDVESHQGTKARLASGVLINCNGNAYHTDEYGNVTIPFPRGSVSFYLAGHVERTLTGLKLEENPKVLLQQESDHPVVSALWAGTTNILSETMHVDLMNEPAVLLRVDAVGGGSELTQLYLRQDAATVDLLSGSATVTWADHFDVSEPIYLIAVNADGLRSVYELKLHVDAFLLNQLGDFKFDLNKLNFTIDSDTAVGGMEFESGLYSPVTCTIAVENDRFYVAIGLTPGFESDSLSGGIKSKDLFQSVKDLIGSLDGISDYDKQYQTIQDFMKKHDKNLVKGKGQWGFEADFTILGFAEGYVNKKGEAIFLDSGAILGAKAKGEFTKPFVAGPVPAFFTIALASEIQSRINLYINSDAQAFIPNSTITWATTLTGELGVGAKDVVSFSGGVDGTLTSTWDLDYEYGDYYKLRGSANVFGKIELAKMELKVPFDPFYDEVLYEYPETIAPTSVTPMANIYDESSYSFQGVDGIENISDAAEDVQEDLLQQIAGQDPAVYGETSVFAANTYPYAEPMMVRQSDGSLAAFFVAKGAGDTMNDLQLYVSVFRDGAWSDPSRILDDGTADNAPHALTVGNETWLIWQNISEPVSDDITLEELAEKTVIQAARFDQNGTLLETTQLTQPGTLCTSPRLCYGGGVLHAVWQTNSENSWFGNNNANSIWTAAYSGGVWGENTEKYSGLNMIASMDAVWQNNRLEIAWSEDTDGDVTTTDDLEVFLVGYEDSDNDVVDNGVCFGNGFLYWYQDGLLVTEDNPDSAVASLPTDRYQMVVVNNDTRVIVYKISTGLSSQLMAIWREAGTGWLDPVPISNANQNVGDYSITYDGEVLSVLYTATEVTDDETAPLGQTHLLFKQITPQPDVQLVHVSSEGNTYMTGRDMMLELELTNRGGTSSGICTVQVLAGDQILAEDTLYTPILPGSTRTESITFPIDQVQQGLELTVNVLCEGDANAADNTATHTLSWGDLALEQLTWGLTGTGEAVITGTVVNRGYQDFGDVTVSLRRDGPDGEAAAQQTVAAAELLSSGSVTFTVDAEDQVWYMTLELTDDRPGNNSAFTTVYADNTEDAPADPEAPEPVVPDPRMPFTDVPAGSFYYDPVIWAVENGITNGTSDTTFSPNDPCMRAHVVTFLWRAAGSPEPKYGINPFVDVYEGDFYYDAVLWAAENSITTGLDATHFGPYELCNRAQVVTFLWRANGWPSSDTYPEFVDVKMNDFYYDAVCWALDAGITNGISATEFGGGNVCNRAQIGTFLYRTYHN